MQSVYFLIKKMNAYGQYTTISDSRHLFNRRFGVQAIEFKFRFNSDAFDSITTNISELFSVRYEDQLRKRYEQCFNELVNFITNVLVLNRRDYVGIKFQLPTSSDAHPFGLPFMEVRQLSAAMITDLLQSVQQSNSIFESLDAIEVLVTTIENRTDVGKRVPLRRVNLDNYRELCKVKQRSILVPKKEYAFTDDKCLARALVIGKEWCDSNKDRKKMHKLLNTYKCAQLKRKTNELIEKTFKDKTYDIVKSGFKLHDLVQFSKVLKNYQIIVYDDRYLHERPLYHSKKKKCQKN